MDLPRDTLVLVAGANLGWQLRAAWLGYASRRWPATQGTVVQLYMDDSALSFLFSGRDGEDGGHHAHVRYAYEVDGRRFRSRRVGYRPRWPRRRDDARGRLRTPMVGGALQVFHDPGRPARSVLVTGASLGNVVLCGLAVALLALAAWFAG